MHLTCTYCKQTCGKQTRVTNVTRRDLDVRPYVDTGTCVEDSLRPLPPGHVYVPYRYVVADWQGARCAPCTSHPRS